MGDTVANDLQYYAFVFGARPYVGWFGADGKLSAIEDEGGASVMIDARTMRTIGDADVVEPHIIWRRGDPSSTLIDKLIDHLAYAKWHAPEVDIHETYDCEKQQLEALLAAGSIATARKHALDSEFHWLLDRELAQRSLQGCVGKGSWGYTITEKGRAWLERCRLIETKMPWPLVERSSAL